VAREAATGLRLIDERGAALAIVDVGLPGGVNGLDVCRQVRADGDLPLILLTARDAEIDRVLGLELGADDYVVKPFSARELMVRVKNLLRRADGRREAPAVLVTGAVEVDLGRREARVEGVPVPLAAREFDLLAFLASNVGRALTRQQLLDGVWGPGWVGDERTVDVHVRQLRRKLGPGLALATVWGVGYRLG
jgi:DNA-binding response OmpR family regulator